MSDDTIAVGAGDDQPERADTIAHKSLPGHILQSRREELNWSVEDVAHSLHLAPRQIHALETDNYSALPGMAIARGFLRSYAKLLKLDPVPLLQMIATESDARREDVSLRRALPDKPFYANRSLTLGAKSRTWVRGSIALLLILLVGLFFAWKADLLSLSWISEAKNLLAIQAESTKTNESQSINESFANAGAAPTPVDSEMSAAVPEQTKNTAVNVMARNASGANELQSAATSSNTSEQSSDGPGRADMLVLSIREESWIEIRDSRDKVLLSRLAKAGESEAIPVREPLKLKIGNASGVDAQLRGVPVELSASANNNVARLTVN